MVNKFSKWWVVWAVIIAMLTGGCSSIINLIIISPTPQASFTPSSTATTSSTPFQAVTNTPIVIPPTFTPSATYTPMPTNTPMPTDTPLPTDTPMPTDTPIPTITPPLEWNPSGNVTAPILLYHHVSDAGFGNRYYVTLDNFRVQMQALRDWGYTTITPSDLVNVLINGGELPNRPIVITFDDGNLDVYQYAFPIMQEMGFVGAFYIVGNRLQSNYFVKAEQIQEMANAGWEIGSHGMTHATLTVDYSSARYEILESRLRLQEATGEGIDTFAYAYGLTDNVITNKVSEYGYQAAMGLGRSWEHSLGTLFYLARIEVQGDYNISVFASLLPWSGN